MTNAQAAESQVKNPAFLMGLRITGFIEGCSTLILFFIAMPLKYLINVEQAVRWPGRIHGGLFVLLVVLGLIAIKKVPITPKLSLLVILAAIIPFGPFLVDKKLKALT